MLNMNAYLCMTSCNGTHATEVIKLTYLLTWLVAWSDGCINEITLHWVCTEMGAFHMFNVFVFNQDNQVNSAWHIEY